MDQFLRSTQVIDWAHPELLAHARALSNGHSDPVVIATRCFEWVRDEVKHSYDYGLTPVTCVASDVLRVGSGYCYAKSHLLAALLRANGIPAGFCYQRLSLDGRGAPFSLHGLTGCFLPSFGWYRIDPRGNRAGIDAQCAPPVERLAFAMTVPGEADLPEIWADPLPCVIEALATYTDARSLYAHLPDVVLTNRHSR